MKQLVLVSICLVVLLPAAGAFAEPAPGADTSAAGAKGDTPPKSDTKWLVMIGACAGAAAAAIGGGLAIAKVGSNCMDAMARQPEVSGSLFAPMIVTAAMIEGAMLFAIVICLLAVLP